ncbi:hypothetical protein [uncultured Pseudomonas sp.]|uniref:hypothetical protein n=1 Tax=uncultured Pseudomonas sp. TaxID=114707 RepID=UPI0025CD9481|nr:hypothetical protein [uncultured Pseudomonas sp.]
MSLKAIIASENTELLADTENLEIRPMDEWTIKAVDGSRKGAKNTKIFFITLIVLMWLAASWFIGYGTDEDKFLAKFLASFCTFLALLAMKEAFQKSIFHYTLYSTHGQYSVALDYHKHTESTVRYTVIGLFIAYALFALYMKSLQVFLVGVIYVLLSGAVRLMHWKRPDPELVKSSPWKDFNFVIVDRKYRIVVLLIDEPTIGFEARLLDNQHVERYLAFLQTVLPPCAVPRRNVGMVIGTMHARLALTFKLAL